VKDREDFKGASLYEGSVGNLDALLAVTEGAGAVIDCHGVSPPRFTSSLNLVRHPRHVPNSPYNVNFMGIKRLIAAMDINKVGKLVRVTGAITGTSPFSLPVVLFNLLLSMTCKWHERCEIAIRESGLDYTVVRPTEISCEPSACETGRRLVLIPGDSDEKRKLGKISLYDVASLCVSAGLGEGKLSRATVVVSSVAGGAGDSTWAPLVASRAQADWRPLQRRWHELPTTLYATAFAASLALFLVTIARLFLRVTRTALLWGAA